MKFLPVFPGTGYSDILQMNGPAPIHFAAYAAHPHHQGEVDYHDFHRSLIAELRTAVPYTTTVPVNR